MPRRPRSDLSGFPLHVIQRGNNRSNCFYSDADRSAYLRWLGFYAARFEIAIHAWVLMSNHVHLLLSPPSARHVSLLMQCLGRRYVRYVNEAQGRSGTLWEGRFRACPVHAEDYLFGCMRYIELNPVRAGIVPDPGGYRWSSYHRNAVGLPDPLVSDHPLYTGLGASVADRQKAYRTMFNGRIDEVVLAHIREAAISGRLLTQHGPHIDSDPVRRNQKLTLTPIVDPASRL